MEIITVNNLQFDDHNADCFIHFSYCQGMQFAFIQVLDLGTKAARLKPPHKKRYWGEYHHEAPEGSILQIMKNGGQWPSLPK